MVEAINIADDTAGSFGLEAAAMGLVCPPRLQQTALPMCVPMCVPVADRADTHNRSRA